MFTTTVQYKDFNDKQHTEQLYFHIMTPDLADLQFDPNFQGDMGEYIKTAMNSGDGQKIYTFFKLMIVTSYGRRSEDGSEFIKKPEFTEKFMNSRAYEEFFVWLLTNPKNAEAFWNGIMPEKLAGLAEEADGRNKKSIQDMSKEELLELFQKKMAANATPAAVES